MLLEADAMVCASSATAWCSKMCKPSTSSGEVSALMDSCGSSGASVGAGSRGVSLLLTSLLLVLEALLAAAFLGFLTLLLLLVLAGKLVVLLLVLSRGTAVESAGIGVAFLARAAFIVPRVDLSSSFSCLRSSSGDIFGEELAVRMCVARSAQR